jgi:hypothetical protein
MGRSGKTGSAADLLRSRAVPQSPLTLSAFGSTAPTSSGGCRKELRIEPSRAGLAPKTEAATPSAHQSEGAGRIFVAPFGERDETPSLGGGLGLRPQTRRGGCK